MYDVTIKKRISCVSKEPSTYVNTVFMCILSVRHVLLQVDT